MRGKTRDRREEREKRRERKKVERRKEERGERKEKKEREKPYILMILLNFPYSSIFCTKNPYGIMRI